MRAQFFLFGIVCANLLAQSSDVPLTTDKVYIGKPEAIRNEASKAEISKARERKATRRRSLEMAERLSQGLSGARYVQLADKSYCANSRAQFAINAEDDESGIARFHYKIDDADWVVYTGPVSITKEGLHDLKWESFDKVGNRESQQSLRVRIDNTPPILTISPQGRFTARNKRLIAAPGFRFKVTAHDQGCGVQGVYAKVDSGGWSTIDTAVDLPNSGIHQVLFMAEDILGNRSDIIAHTVEIDAKAPVTELAVQPPPVRSGATLLCRPNTLITITASDHESGVERIEHRFAPDADWVSSVGSTMPVDRSDNFYLEARSVDAVGNTESKPVVFQCRAVGAPPRTVITPLGEKR